MIFSPTRSLRKAITLAAIVPSLGGAYSLTVTCRTLGHISADASSSSDEDGSSFLATTGVSTYVCQNNDSETVMIHNEKEVQIETISALHDRWGPAVYLHNVLSKRQCHDIKNTCERSLGFGNFDAGKNKHGALQLLVSNSMAQSIANRIQSSIDVHRVEERKREMEDGVQTDKRPTRSLSSRLEFAGINRRWRVYRYQPDAQETFAPHIDAGFPASGLDDQGRVLFDVGDTNTISRLTLLLYLNDDFVGGETVFYEPSSTQILTMVRPVAGSALLFPQAVGAPAVDYARQHWPLHEGSILRPGREPKYVIRSDVLFRQVHV